MNNFTQRAITGLSFAFVMALAIMYNVYTLSAIFFVILTLGLLEFYRLIKSDDVSPQVITGLVVSQILFFMIFFYHMKSMDAKWLQIVIPLVALVFIAELFRKKNNPFLNIAYTLTGVMYIALPVYLTVTIAITFHDSDTNSFHGNIIMGAILLIWASDTGAYMIGSKLGKHRLFERISPKKSWEGFAGGLIVAVLSSFIINMWFPDLEVSQWMMAAIIIVITGTLGDLVESMLKRSLGVKDSGNFLPGHGGILDRFDAYFISIPFVYFYLVLIDKI